MKYLFLDTNVLLHFKSFDGIPWETIVNDTNYTVVIPFIVVTELDAHKTNPIKKLAAKAKKAIAKIDKILSGEDLGISVKLISHWPADDIYSQNRLSISRQDDSLIAAIIEYSINAEDEKILVTYDTHLKIKASAYNIKCIAMPEIYKLEDEKDESEKKIAELERENHSLKFRQPKPSLGFEDGTKKMEYVQEAIPLSRSEYVRKELELIKQEYPHMVAQDPYIDMLPLISLYKVTDSQRMSYNAHLDTFYKDYHIYLYKEYDYKVYLSTCIELEFSMVNTGTVPADDIDIHLQFPDGFELLKKLDEAPRKPNAPERPKSPFSSPNGLMGLAELINPHRGNTPEDLTKPKLAKLANRNALYRLGTLKHGNNTITLGKLYARFDDINSMKNFNITYQIVVRNLADSIEGKLNVVFVSNK